MMNQDTQWVVRMFLTISKRIDFGADKTIKDAVVSFNATRPFIMTSYTGTDPSPELFDALQLHWLI